MSDHLNKYTILWETGACQMIKGTTLKNAFLRAGYDDLDKIRGEYVWKPTNFTIRKDSWKATSEKSNQWLSSIRGMCAKI